MIEDIKKFKINWIDGMKISKDHFQGLQDYSENNIKDAFVSQRGRHGYGFLPSNLNGKNEFRITLDVHSGLKVSIDRLRAVTPNGNRIEITPNTPEVADDITVEALSEKKTDTGFLLLNLDPENPVAFGEQDSKEVPPRFPFLSHGYFFSFINADELGNSGLGGNQLPCWKL